MIEEIRIRNFRHFEDVTFRPHEHTSLLCGLNGTGKSTIVELMHRLKRFVVDGQPVGAVFGPADMPLWDKQFGAVSSADLLGYGQTPVYLAETRAIVNTIVMEASTHWPAIHVSLLINKNKFIYLCRLVTVREKEHFRLYINESLHHNDRELYLSLCGNAHVTLNGRTTNYKINQEISGIALASEAHADIKEFLNYIATHILTLSIDPLVIKSSHQKPTDSLSLNAHNFPAWYAHQVGTSLLAVTACFKEYAAFIPGFAVMVQDPRKTPVPLEANIKLSSEKSYMLPFASFSHGQKVLCVLHTVIKLAPQGSTIFIDEFENYLSPSELVPLYSAMQDAFEERGVQFVLVSHHQKTLNWFRDSAFIFTFSKDSPTVQLTPFDAEKHGEIYEYLDELAGEQA